MLFFKNLYFQDLYLQDLYLQDLYLQDLYFDYICTTLRSVFSRSVLLEFVLSSVILSKSVLTKICTFKMYAICCKYLEFNISLECVIKNNGNYLKTRKLKYWNLKVNFNLFYFVNRIIQLVTFHLNVTTIFLYCLWKWIKLY